MPDPEQHSSRLDLTAILLVRLAGLLLLALISFLLSNDDTAVNAVMGIAFIITIPYSLWLRSRLHTVPFASRQFFADLLLVTALVYFTGGRQSHLTLLYPLIILSAGIVGPLKQAAVSTASAIVVYSLIAALPSNGQLAEYFPAQSMFNPDSPWLAIPVHGLVFALMGGAGMYVSKHCVLINPHEHRLNKATSLLLGSIPVPLLLLNTEGLIVYANEPACDALNATNEFLCTKKFSALCQKEGKPIPESFGRSAYLIRTAKSLLPVSYTTRDINIEEAALREVKCRKENVITITLLLFTDITDALSTSQQLHKVDRLASATRIAGEMAHEIRAPLSTLSASVQLLRHYENKATAADWLPNSPRRNDRRELFEHIEEASARMDNVIRNFVDFAEFSPQDLLSIIKLDSIGKNQGYIDHLNTRGRDLKDGQNTHS